MKSSLGLNESSENIGFRARVVLAAFKMRELPIEYIYRLFRLYCSLVNSFGDTVLFYIFALKFAGLFLISPKTIVDTLNFRRPLLFDPEI